MAVPTTGFARVCGQPCLVEEIRHILIMEALQACENTRQRSASCTSLHEMIWCGVARDTNCSDAAAVVMIPFLWRWSRWFAITLQICLIEICVISNIVCGCLCSYGERQTRYLL